MKRREFLIATASAAALSCTGCKQSTKPTNHKKLTVPKSTEIEEVGILQLQEMMNNGSLSASDITKLYLDRIENVDRSGPSLNAVIEVNCDAIAIAMRLDDERRQGKLRGPLHGIPILIKDNIETGDKMMTTAGSLALEGWIAKYDSEVVRRLRVAGAVVLGKTNLSEWANFRSTNATSGWSGRGGQTRNAYVLNRNPCGSSSGSGVAASASLCAAAIGTETNGSVVCPSSINGVVGIKPTLGLVSRSRIIPLAHSQDTAGPMARTVEDAALLLSAMAGEDQKDAVTQHGKGFFGDKPWPLNPISLKGKRIGVARNFFGFHSLVDQLAESAIGAIKELGADIIDPVELRGRGAGRSSFEVMLYEFKSDINQYLATIDPELPVHTLEELIEFNQQHAAQEMPYFGQELFEMAQEKGGLDDQKYQDALMTMRAAYRENGLDRVLNKDKLDAIIAPTTGPAWVTDLIHGDHGSGGSSTPAACAGYPNITVPMGYVLGLPVGLSFFGAAFSEPQLIQFAFAFEQATGHRQPPQYLPSVGDAPESAV